ncbi:MAG: ArsR/SmtB family transcription factor [Thermoguttaceae bacterium]
MTISNKPKRDKKALYEARAQVAQAMGHPARMLVLDVLSEKGECCVCELTEMIGSEMPTVSRHLSVLKNAGLISDEKRGKNVFYTLTCPCINSFFGCIEEVIKANIAKNMRLVG